jgi:hypothetical protein
VTTGGIAAPAVSVIAASVGVRQPATVFPITPPGARIAGSRPRTRRGLPPMAEARGSLAESSPQTRGSSCLQNGNRELTIKKGTANLALRAKEQRRDA